MHKVLVIDDNPDVREILRLALEMRGYKVTDAEGGKPGLAALETDCPDIILLDYNMPDMNGVDVAKQARLVCGNIPIIFITAHSNVVATGITTMLKTDIVPKPFMLDTLSHRICAMLH